MSEQIKSILRVSDIQIGDSQTYNKNSLKGYVAESKLKRIISLNQEEILNYILKKFKIDKVISIRSETKRDSSNDKLLYDHFDTIDIIKIKISDMDAKQCLKLLSIYEEKGIYSLINAIHFLSPIHKI